MIQKLQKQTFARMQHLFAISVFDNTPLPLGYFVWL